MKRLVCLLGFHDPEGGWRVNNIGDIRRSLFVPWESQWNGWVRDETASREGQA